MRHHASAVLFGAALWLLARENAAAMTPEALLQSCQAVISAAGAERGPEIDIPATGLPCWYYMSAVQNMSALVDESGERLLGVCAPPDTTLMDFVRTIVQHARELEDGNAAAFVLPELAEAFPCKPAGK
jgi:hypothetical protein